jgi:hypothetical protein
MIGRLLRSVVPVAALIIAFQPSPGLGQTPQEVVLSVSHGPGPLDVTLIWTGGQSPFEVLRSTDVSMVCSSDNVIGTTDIRIWIDNAPQGSVFYKIRSPLPPEPSEVCNGRDDDCDGTIDDDATGCNASLCQDCIGGACRSRCGPCDDCVNGTCQTRCGPCQACAGGVCAPCSPAQCQTCVNGSCQSTCDANQCQVCGGGGVCVSFCQSCEICTAGICMDACDRDNCLSCQSGSCRPLCDPICQTCTPLGCRDNCAPCERCQNGTCQSRCNANACEECQSGFCQSRCQPGESCTAGQCGSTGAGPESY